MSSIYFKNIFRFLLLVFTQILILRQINLGQGFLSDFYFIIYPLFILLLPFRTPRWAVLLIGFFLGLFIDFGYNSLGVHASASVFTAFMRSPVIGVLEPRGGYNLTFSPTKARMGWGWFIRYASILLALHLLVYFSVEAFTFFYIGKILREAVASFLVSISIILIYQVILNPID